MVTVIPAIVGALGKMTGRTGNDRKNRDYPDDSNVEIGKNAEKRLGDLRSRSVTQTPVKEHQLMLECKTHWE